MENWTKIFTGRDTSSYSSLVFSTGLNTDYTALTDVFTITSGGKVGIGTTNPGKELDVVGDVNFSGDLVVDNTTKIGGNSQFSNMASFAHFYEYSV